MKIPQIDKGPLWSLILKYSLVAPLFYAMFFLETHDHIKSSILFSISSIIILGFIFFSYSFFFYGNFSFKEESN